MIVGRVRVREGKTEAEGERDREMFISSNMRETFREKKPSKGTGP